MQRRVEQPDRDREPGHRLEDPLEVALLQRQQPFERAAALLLAAGEDHLPHDRQPALGHEHVLGAAEADPLGSELARLRRVLGRVRVGAHAEPAELVRPGEDRLEVLVDRGWDERDGSDDHAPGAAVDRDRVALVQRVLADRHLAGAHVDRERLAARHARLPHPARDDGGVRGHAAVGREDAAGLDQPVDVVRRRLPADEDHVLTGFSALLGGVGVEHDRA